MTSKSSILEKNNNLKRKKLKKEKKAACLSLKNFMDPSHHVWKNLSLEEIQKIKEIFLKRSQSKIIYNPLGWIRRCIEEKWHLQELPGKASQKCTPVKNYNFCKKIEKLYPYAQSSYFTANRKSACLVKQSQEIFMPSYDVEHEEFKTLTKEILKKYNCPVENWVL